MFSFTKHLAQHNCHLLFTQTQAMPSKPLQKLSQHPVWALVAAFGTYFCMYGFRKPYTAATYTDVAYWGIDYKFLLIISQTLGYMLAKWIGIKVVAEIKPSQRIKVLIGLILFAELTLLLFGFVPRPWNIVCLLLNGLPLGVVFGLVLGFLEGRRHSEALIAGLCASFIVADGASKSIGNLLLHWGVPESWMPFAAGIFFMVPMAIFVAMLNVVPAPSTADVTSRSERTPMSSQARKAFFIKYAPGISGITIVYLFVTILRSIRADFAPELWRDLGFKQTPEIFTQSELLVSLGVVIISGFAVLIKNHYKAFRFALMTCVFGFAILLVAINSVGHGMGNFAFMVLVGLGVYIPYVAIHTTIFERLIAITKERANIGFLMYVVDAVGYTGYILLMLLRYLAPPDSSILSLFLRICVYIGISGGLLVLFCNWYFKMKLKENESGVTQLSTR